ncbi:hypothetical protein GPECTOR_15g494 [Gonium pectorale]|uniref:BACK domain-containing protein n=1 Tax=Gonium pectorale TaxID=33097 RepID=A0A150GM06_GONPE|nr:hypothetical protein GPECTOR_15g494 [Gonium pectorale]|eukprot:KXZ50808.1 hypothetical protein GPECTOR_15g494 [Gonium pectorale]
MPPLNPRVAEALAGSFGSAECADCWILFVREQPVVGSKRNRSDCEPLAEALPAHTYVLRPASERFAANLREPWRGRTEEAGGAKQQQQEPSASAAATAGGGLASGLPVLLVQLNCAEEVPSARAAIKFAYTGQVEPDSSVRELIELYRQGEYLQARPTEPAFAAIMAKAIELLVAHFGDALTTLNTPELRRQLLALPAEALMVLLAADCFGTDVEDTVLLMLALWIQENGSTMEVEALELLCRLVRLAQLSPDFAGAVLPALACARSVRPEQPGSGGLGWFPIKSKEASFLASCCASATSAPKLQRLMDEAKRKLNLPAKWFSTKPHRQCFLEATSRGKGAAPVGPSEQQHPQPATWPWSISREQLELGLQKLQPGGVMRLECALDNGLSAVSARGYEWRATIDYKYGANAAGLYLCCRLPAAYCLDMAALGGPLAALAQVGARLEADRWRNGAREVAFTYKYGASIFMGVDADGWGIPSALPLKHGGGGVAADGGGGGGLLNAWSEYLHDGKITGRLSLLQLST